MARAATMVYQVQSGGSDNQCGGGFNAARGGVDYTLQNAAQATGTVTSATTTVTATTGIFTAQMVGNCITDGTTYVEITAFTSATQVTVDSAPSWTAATVFVGGAMASPGKAESLATLAGQGYYVLYNATPYAITTASTNVAGGCLAPVAGTFRSGYNTTRTPFNTDALQPTLQVAAAVSAATILGTTGFLATNLILDGNLQTTSRGLGSGTGVLFNCTLKNFTNGATAGSGSIVRCLITGCTTTIAVSCSAYLCVATANTVTGFGATIAVDCISYGNTGATSDGFSISPAVVLNCVAYNNGRDGFRVVAGTTLLTLVNCVAEGNAGFGFDSAAATTRLVLVNCGDFGNTSGRSNSATIATVDQGPIAGVSSFFANAASGNFAINTTTGAGAALKAAGYPATFPGGLTAHFRDVGAAQHQDAGSVAGMLFVPSLEGW